MTHDSTLWIQNIALRFSQHYWWTVCCFHLEDPRSWLLRFWRWKHEGLFESISNHVLIDMALCPIRLESSTYMALELYYSSSWPSSLPQHLSLLLMIYGNVYHQLSLALTLSRALLCCFCLEGPRCVLWLLRFWRWKYYGLWKHCFLSHYGSRWDHCYLINI